MSDEYADGQHIRAFVEAALRPRDGFEALRSWASLVPWFEASTKMTSEWLKPERQVTDADLACLRAARIVEIALQDVISMLEEFDFYLSSAGLKVTQAIESTHRSERPPFDSTFIGLRILPHELDGADTMNASFPFGYLVSAHCYWTVGFNWDQYRPVLLNVDRLNITDRIERTRAMALERGFFGPWREGLQFGLLVLPDLLFRLMAMQVDLTLEKRLLPMQRGRIKDILGRGEQRKAPIPRSYHRIRVTGRTTWTSAVREAIVATGRTWKLTHRIDVRAHWWVRVREGDGLVSAEMREKLDPSYIWLDDHNPNIDPETWELIASRGVQPRQPGRWMGILKRWIGPHQRGPADGPYVPALWVVEAGGAP